ncbi:MAG: MarC family protein [Acidobacteriota bacterium]
MEPISRLPNPRYVMPDQLPAILRSTLLSIAALMPIVNPIGSAPVFLAMSADLPPLGRRLLARKVAINAFVLLIAAMLVGSHILRFFGISIPIVRVGGGLLVMANGWRLINSEEPPRAPHPGEAWERGLSERAFFPLTFPLTVGPGSISVAVTLGARLSGIAAVQDLVSEVIAVGVIAVIVFLSYRFASRLIGSLGATGTSVFLRLSSFILLCVGVAILWSGIEELVRGMRL